MADLSPTTGEQYYSGDWQDISNFCKSLNIVGEGKLATISQETVNNYQEDVDRQIDDILHQSYYTPLRQYRVYSATLGTTQSVFPGEVRLLARELTAYILLRSEFHGAY